jgi:putative SOS response-associated peptidase YedK
MCGRYAFSHSVADMQALFDVANPEQLGGEARYNIAPTQPVNLVFRDREAVRRAGRARWGLVPSWVKDPREWKASTFNARSEDAAVKPTFRQAVRRGRVLIPASGFYEWKRENGAKAPYYVRASDGGPLAFAGLMDVWRGKEGDERLVSCAILTTASAGRLQDLHDRMPVMVPAEEFDDWLGGSDGAAALERIVASGPDRDLEVYRVSTAVNSARDDRPEFSEPVGQ